ncbi:hypothetical protein WA026_012702 [Henosepilachna vigintioctopunctata]|uniref:Uncharacterized protein n=1 Tax=Henosepilachna vigintioctopunctata TaxID=420089 RepID=A0AAW1U8Z1_9CUCU
MGDFSEQQKKYLEHLIGDLHSASVEKGGQTHKVFPYYRPQSYQVEEFMRSLETLFRTKKRGEYSLCYLEYININVLDQSDPVNLKYLEILSKHGFSPVINSPTTETEISSSLIDHIFVNSSGVVVTEEVSSFILKTNIIDYYW